MKILRTTLTLALLSITNATVANEPVAYVIEITGFAFVPASLTVNAGDTITWINKDIAPHTASADDLSFDTGELKQNASMSVTVSGEQTISYFCRYHPSMKARLIVE